MQSNPAVDARMRDFFSLWERPECRISGHHRRRPRQDWRLSVFSEVEGKVGLRFLMPDL